MENYRQIEFVADMGIAYACADVVVARSGAGTVFELLALKKPALFIPLDGPTRGDQKENAEYFRKKGLCHVLPRAQLHRLVEAIDALANDESVKDNLQNCVISSANPLILRRLEETLRESEER